MDVDVILTQDDPKLGCRGQVVKVSPGFALNFLIPQGKAKHATHSNLKAALLEKARLEKTEAEHLAQVTQTAQRVAQMTCTLEASAGQSGKLFGAVTAQQIVEQLAADGIHLEKKAVHLKEPIHQLGSYVVELKLRRDLTAPLKLEVIKKS